jgi:RsiW-degrading membrane proteinase PrsW (M82 family)
MITQTTSTPLTARRTPHLRWLAVLLAGLALFAAVLAVMVNTGNPVYVPSLLLLGAAVAPATFTTFIEERQVARRLSVAHITVGAVLGAAIGTLVAGQVEYETVRELGALPTVLIGIIEEGAKLSVPAVMLAATLNRWRPRAIDGLVLGVAVGSGFAVLETMGCAFVELLRAGDQPAPAARGLLARRTRCLDRPRLRRPLRRPRRESPMAGPGCASCWSSPVWWSCTPRGTAPATGRPT